MWCFWTVEFDVARAGMFAIAQDETVGVVIAIESRIDACIFAVAVKETGRGGWTNAKLVSSFAWWLVGSSAIYFVYNF